MTAVSVNLPLIDNRYRLHDVIGTGVSAVVWRAHDERLRRDVAVKLFRPLATDGERQGSQLALMASLVHRALVRVFDGGQDDDRGTGSTYLVMELICGPTLRGALAHGAMAQDDVVSFGGDLAAALAFVHAHGAVHLDVTPANVLLPVGDAVTAKLADFGVARLLDGARPARTGPLGDTANYLSPEQVRGQDVGPPSDIYSLGLVLLEALTGRTAYEGDEIAVALARLSRPPMIPSALGRQWMGLLVAMLSPHPSARPDAARVCFELAAIDARQGRTTERVALGTGRS